MGTDSAEKLVEIGVVGRPHGIGGGVRVFLHNPDSVTILEAPRLFFKQSSGSLSETALLELRRGNRCLIARFDGVTRREDAERLKGAKIFVRRDALPPPDDDEFYVADLIGIVAYEKEHIVGRVVSSRAQGGIEVLRIVGEAEEVEVPLVEDFVAALDVPGGRIDLRDIEDLPRYSVHKRFKK